LASVTSVGGLYPHTYQWNDPAAQTSNEAINLCAGNYTVTITDAQGCELFQSINIQQPLPLIGSDFTTEAYCEGECIGTSYVTIAGGTPGYSITWNNPDSASTFYINKLCEGIYTYTVTDVNGCEFTDSVEVIYSNYYPVLIASVDKDTIYLGETTTVYATNDFGYNHTWYPTEGLVSPFAANSIAGPSQTITYYVQVADSNGCINIDSVTIWVKTAICDDPEIFVPNAFTPDNNNVNDILFVRGNAINKIYFTIYDRWGQQVFETEDIKSGWDGRFKGKEAAAGVYVYYVEGTCFGGFTFFKKGNITLMR
jgi:gliding motility-associated-like protein